MKRNIQLNDYVHITSRGIKQSRLFYGNEDYTRFLTSIFIMQYGEKNNNFHKVTNLNKKLLKGFNLPNSRICIKVGGKNIVEVCCYCLMPNHFHLLLKNITEYGVSKFMKRIKLSHSHAQNKKYGLNGYKFDSKFHSTIITSKTQLHNTINYIHKNPKDLKSINNDIIKISDYEYSSCKDYTYKNRWGKHLKVISQKSLAP